MMGRKNNNWIPVAGAPAKLFKYGYNIDPQGPGGFSLNAIRKDAPVVGGCREKNPDNRSTFER
jgi:hypothetical protein